MNGYGGIFGAPGMWAATKPYQNKTFAGMGMAQQPAPEKKPSFFGEGGTGRNIAGFIGDYLLQQSGMRPIYQPTMMQRRAEQQALEAEQRQMQQQRDLYTFKRQADLQYPDPVKPPTVAQEVQWFNSLPPEQQAMAAKALDALRPITATTWQGPVPVPRAQSQMMGPQLSDIDAELKRRGVSF